MLNARLDDGRVVDVCVDDGFVAAVETVGAGDRTVGRWSGVDVEFDVGGWLLLAAMAEPHAHLDKALTAEQVPNRRGDLVGAIDAWRKAARVGMFTHDEIVGRVRRSFEKLLLNGVTAVRSHVNCGLSAGISNLVAARDAQRMFATRLDVQFVAFPHTPVVGSGGAVNRRALVDAVDSGVDVVGGCPHLETDASVSIRYAIDVARNGGIGLDLHVDETLDASAVALSDLAREIVVSGFDGPVAASHCVSLGMQPPDVQAAVARAVADAGIAVITLPQTNLYLQGRDWSQATPRGLTALAALADAGVLVAAGADNVQDPFNPLGRSDPLETAALLVMAGHMSPVDAYEMVSNNARRVMGLPPVRFEPGAPADFVAIDAPSIRAAIADAPANRMVFHGGCLVASSSTRHELHGG